MTVIIKHWKIQFYSSTFTNYLVNKVYFVYSENKFKAAERW